MSTILRSEFNFKCLCTRADDETERTKQKFLFKYKKSNWKKKNNTESMIIVKISSTTAIVLLRLLYSLRTITVKVNAMFIILLGNIAPMFTWQMNKERVNGFLWIGCNVIVKSLYYTIKVFFFFLQISAENVDLAPGGWTWTNTAVEITVRIYLQDI